MQTLTDDNISRQSFPLTKLLPLLLSLLYFISVNYHAAVMRDESEYTSIAKSFAKAQDFQILHRPTIIVPAVGYLISPIFGLKLDVETQVMLARVFMALIGVLNLFLITSFLKKIKISGQSLPDYLILSVQLLTFINFYYMGSIGAVMTEQLAFAMLFLIADALYDEEFDVYKALMVGFAAAGLVLLKYVCALPVLAIPVYYLYRYKWSGRTLLYSFATLSVLAVLVLPFFFRNSYINANHLAEFSYFRGNQAGSALHQYMTQFGQGVNLTLQRFHELYTTIPKLYNIPLSLPFLVPVFTYLFRSIRKGQLFEFYNLFPLLYMGGLIISGVGFTRYWLLVFPMVNLFILTELYRWKFLQKPFAAGIIDRLPAKGLFLIAGGVILVALLYFRLLSVTVFSQKKLYFILAFLAAFCFGLALLKKYLPRNLAAIIVVMLFAWHGSRSLAEFTIGGRVPPPDKQKLETQLLTFCRQVNTMQLNAPLMVPYYATELQVYLERPIVRKDLLQSPGISSFYAAVEEGPRMLDFMHGESEAGRNWKYQNILADGHYILLEFTRQP
jgi:hypothetical protein